MRIPKALANWLPWLVIVAILIGFHFWGEHQRYREWWWVGGDPKGMLFLDLAHEQASKGHLLSTDGNTGDEFALEWSCKDKTVRWGEMWSKDQNFDQIERRPAPTEMGQWHRATEASELRVLEV